MYQDQFDYEQWTKWRSQMQYVFYNSSVFLGLVYGIYFGTEFLYIKDVLHTPHATLWYGTGAGGQYAISVVGAMFGSIYYDFTKDLKKTGYFFLLCVLLGNVLYSTSESVWFVIAGNVLFGTTSLGVVAYTAEITHIFEESQLTKQLAFNTMFYTVAKLLGPCLAYVFVKVDTSWHGWRISYGNMPSLVMASYTAICLLVNRFCVRNLTQIYDLKADMEFARLNLSKSKQADGMEEANNIFTKEEDEPASTAGDSEAYKQLLEDERNKYEIRTLKQYLSTFVQITIERHFGILIFVSLVLSTSNLLAYQLIVVKAGSVLRWSASMISNLRIVSTVLGMLTAVVISRISKSIIDYYFLVTGVCVTIMLMLLMSVTPFIEDSTRYLSAFLYVNSVVYGISETVAAIGSITMVAKLVRSEFQGIAESLRYCVFFLGYALGSFYIGVASTHTFISCLCAAVMNFCCGILLLFEYKFYVKRAALS